MKRFYPLLLLSLLFAFSCEKDEENDPPSNNSNLTISIDYVFGSNQMPWQSGVMLLHPKTQDSIQINTLNFYISNVRLQRANGTWQEDASYGHLICASCTEGSSFTINGLKPGKYVAMEYTLGVDSAHQSIDGMSDDINHSSGMWDDTFGYSHLRVEGLSPNSPDGTFSFHLKGYEGTLNACLKRETTFFNSDITLLSGSNNQMTLMANPAKLWHSGTSVSILNELSIPAPVAVEMANNFFGNVNYFGMN